MMRNKNVVAVLIMVMAYCACVEHMNVYAGDYGTGIRWSDELVIFGSEIQATVSAGWDIELPPPDVALSDGNMLGLRSMPERQIYLDEQHGRTRDTVNRHFNEPVKIRLSKYHYPHEDRHLDVIVWTSPPERGQEPQGHLKIKLKDAGGDTLAEHEIGELSRSGLFFSMGFPPQLEGSQAALEAVWYDGDHEMGRASATFHVRQAASVEVSGRVPITVLNEPGAHASAAPMTTGVPFPRGALTEASNVRLVDEHGEAVPLQTKVTARWSRFGSIKWLLCDFTADLDGGPRELFLEFGSRASPADVDGRRWASMDVDSTHTDFPRIDAGRLRFGPDGLWFDAAGDGTFQPVLDADAFSGAFVTHENGRTYRPDPATPFVVEESGPGKIVVRRAGWYRDADSGEAFCNYVTRFVFHRNSPVVRIFHTWIFTGDGNRDRIANMGWRFDTTGRFEPDGILSSFEDGVWHQSHHLVQFDYQAYDLLGGIDRGRRDGRAPGVTGGRVGGPRVLFGAKDFWQNFPSELEVSASGWTFYNWPKLNPPATFQRPVSVGDAFRNRFVHEGEFLDFRIPDEYAEGEIWAEATGGGRPDELHFAEGRPETANAQGIARTEEMFLYFFNAERTVRNAALVMQGLNDETLRAVVDPQWMVGSGVFGEIHPRDVENYPEEEKLYALSMSAPARWVERLGVYGMWVYGDYPTWALNLPRRYVSPYRAYRKNHSQGEFPLRLIPFVRSGDPQFMKLAENAARQMADANFCHYADANVNASVGPEHYRRQGWWDRSLLPWTGRLGPHRRWYTIDTDYLWEIYYLTGYARARDVALLFSELTQNDHISMRGGRETQGPFKSYLDIYKATFDPWFLNAFHELADLHVHLYAVDEIDPLMYDHPREIAGFDHWRSADQAYYEYTGCDDYEQMARNSAVVYANPNMVVCRAGTGTDGGGGRHHAFHAWKRTGDEFYLRRMAANLDTLKIQTYLGDLDYISGGGPGHVLSIPMSMAGLATAGQQPDPIHNLVWLYWEGMTDARVFIRHETIEPFDLNFYVRGFNYPERPFQYEIAGPGEFHVSEKGVTPETVQVAGGKGIYRLGIDSEDLRLYIPLSAPDIPEVIGFETSDAGTFVRAPGLGYWFHVPKGVEAFWIDFMERPTPRGYVKRVSVWNPDNERAWDLSYSLEDDPNRPPRVTITVPEGMDGRLWRATGGDFSIDPQIQPYFSVSRTKWFNPEK